MPASIMLFMPQGLHGVDPQRAACGIQGRRQTYAGIASTAAPITTGSHELT
jgi:hypothetical protein